MNKFIEPELHHIDTIQNNIKILLDKLGPLLDKPLNDDPHYACGDALEDIQTWLPELKESLIQCRRIVVAKVGAYNEYPINERRDDDGYFIDENEYARQAYYRGFLSASAE